MAMRFQKKHVILALLILIPAVTNLSVPIYNKALPDLFGLPFFYWFQLMWLFIAPAFYLTFSKIVGKEN